MILDLHSKPFLAKLQYRMCLISPERELDITVDNSGPPERPLIGDSGKADQGIRGSGQPTKAGQWGPNFV